MGDWMRIMRLWAIALLLALATMVSGAIAPVAPAAGAAADLAAARALFEKNLDAIRRHDRSAYLACYLDADTLARTGPEGPQLGYDSLAKETGEDWPDLFEGLDLQLVPVRPGLVYGTYRYRVRYGAREESGISERLFVKTGAVWKIAVTTAFTAPPGTPPPPRAPLRSPSPPRISVREGGRCAMSGATPGPGTCARAPTPSRWPRTSQRRGRFCPPWTSG